MARPRRASRYPNCPYSEARDGPGFILAARIPQPTWDKRDPKFFVPAMIFMLLAFLAMSAIIVSWA